MSTGLAGKTVLVTEAVDNFGPAIALAFARQGANLLLVSSKDEVSLDPTAQEASALGVKVATGTCDTGDENQIRTMVQKGVSEFGHLDVLVNNALLPVAAQSLQDTSFALWKRKIEVEVRGALMTCREVLPGMIARRWGRILNYSGLAAFRGTDAASSTSELAIIGLTRGIAREFGKYNITANCICPGGADASAPSDHLSYPPDAHDPIPRWGKPEEVAFLAVCMAAEEAGYITGQCLLANGGKYFL